MVNLILFTDEKCSLYQHEAEATWGHETKRIVIQKLNHLTSGVRCAVLEDAKV